MGGKKGNEKERIDEESGGSLHGSYYGHVTGSAGITPANPDRVPKAARNRAARSRKPGGIGVPGKRQQ